VGVSVDEPLVAPAADRRVGGRARTFDGLTRDGGVLSCGLIELAAQQPWSRSRAARLQGADLPSSVEASRPRGRGLRDRRPVTFLASHSGARGAATSVDRAADRPA